MVEQSTNNGPFLLHISEEKGRFMEADGRTRYGRQVWKRLEGCPFSMMFYGRTALVERHWKKRHWKKDGIFMEYRLWKIPTLPKFNITYHKILPFY